ncbi:MAG: error-prone DNA polymerase [Agarilytica sp.]
MRYSHLYTLTNHSFLKSASHPQEMIQRAHKLNYSAIAITDECSLAGIVKAYQEAKAAGIKLIVGSTFTLSNTLKIIVIAPTQSAYAELSGFITLTRRRADKGQYEAHLDDLRFRLQNCFIIWLADKNLDDHPNSVKTEMAAALSASFKDRLWIGVNHQLAGGEQARFSFWQSLADDHHIPMLACPCVLMHEKSRKPLHDTLTAILENTPIAKLGTKLQGNAEAYLKAIPDIEQLYPPELIHETAAIADLCTFSMESLRYQYPQELVPKNKTPIDHLTHLVKLGAKRRWPEGTPQFAQAIIDKELGLIEELHYEFYFLTVYDIVNFARSQDILCQGRGSAANSVVCYCLHITEIAPGQINVLFERFISKERDEPPDIDVDFEHQRREEVIQYIYQKYSRERAALAASVVTYRPRSAIRDVGKALGLESALIDHLAKSLAWWDRTGELMQRIEEAGLSSDKTLMVHFFAIVEQIIGFPRHLSQHVGGFVITQGKISDLVPMENASMPDRTVIQWDKDDLEAMGLLKVDVLALGMLTALKKALAYVHAYTPHIKTIADIPKEDPATYAMLSRGDSLGVFQVESRAQMSMLPRLKPQKFYDLVIEIAIVRPGPIQGDMVHPYLRRRDGIEAITYQNDKIKSVLEPTLGVPIFQEQAIRLAMVAAGFSGGQADQLRRAMASWGKNGNLLAFETSFTEGMLTNGYDKDFAQRLFSQIKGFGGYGFPESHSASFALLCYLSSWLKCHHPAAFYCALLNSQPMGFYSPSQLIQDARRHHITILPVNINDSAYENILEKMPNTTGEDAQNWGIRLGLCRIKSLASETAGIIEQERRNTPYISIQDLIDRTHTRQSEIQTLAAADAFHGISGHRYQSHWQASAAEHNQHPNEQTHALLLKENNNSAHVLSTTAPSIEHNILLDVQTTGVSLRPHPMVLFRQEVPFKYCKKQNELAQLGNGRFVHVAGLVTGRQRPGTAKGTLFLTLEDETGNINIVVWKTTQQRFRHTLLHATLISIKGRLESKGGVIHIIAGHLEDHSDRLKNFALKSRDFH